MSNLKKIIILLLLCIVGWGVYYITVNNVKIVEVELTSPDNSALKEDIRIVLNKPSSVYIEYWKEGAENKYRTKTSKKKVNHEIHLLLLEPEATYQYKIVVEGLINNSTDVKTFETREASPWMVHNWIKEDQPHDATALGGGMVMLCYRGFPGYIAIVDGKGTVRWYWQDDNLGVRIATITPRNTIIALLAPATKDEFKKTTNVAKADVASYYLRTGKTGFVGGTEIVEIDLEGNELWRINIEDKGIVFHHDIQMNDRDQIMSIYRDYKMYDLKGMGAAKDTLWGDGVMIMDTLGNVVDKWSAWDVWDLSIDKKIKEYSGDRFHFNSIRLDKNGNYLLSTPIENQVWNVNPSTGEIVWKLGEGGDFKMDANSYFNFQHDAHFNREGDLMLFDNGDFSPNDTTKVNKFSRSISFTLDTVNMKATTKIDARLPSRYYTSRMGGSILLPNNNILHTSSKTGGVVVTNQEGKVFWALNAHFIPYRVEYVPQTMWSNYFKTTQR
ncbi:arylsulfotransferase family protein [Galbibacter orientalis]|uniref:arylsulfotransferase family protein n=1 Tax=Galbibacter orientalis TaxID=453852 RepID=UPI00307FEBED